MHIEEIDSFIDRVVILPHPVKVTGRMQLVMDKILRHAEDVVSRKTPITA